MVLETVCIVEENIDHCVFSFLFFSFLFLPFKIFSLRLPIFFFNLLNDLKQLIYIHNKLILFQPFTFFFSFSISDKFCRNTLKKKYKESSIHRGENFFSCCFMMCQRPGQMKQMCRTICYSTRFTNP
jgi:hypothetical protein